MIQQCLSVERFLQERFELPESGQWAELVRGTIALQEPPDLDHGNVVLNLSKQLAGYFLPERPGYACFDMGLLTTVAPDTLRFPAVSIFLEGPRFAESDQEYTRTTPNCLIEILSTSDRRRQAGERISEFFEWGVPCLWHIDPHARTVSIHRPHQKPTQFNDNMTLSGEPELAGFSMPVAQLFAEPEWYRGTR